MVCIAVWKVHDVILVAGARFRVLRQTGPGRQAQTGRPRQAEAAEKKTSKQQEQ